MNRALAIPCCLIGATTLALTALWTFFILDRAPKLASEERRRTTLEFRQRATALAAGTETDAATRQKEKGWRQSGKVADAAGRRIPWGYVREGGRVTVWVGEGPEVSSVSAPAEDSSDLAAWLYVGGSLVCVFVLFIGGAGIWLFIRNDRERRDFLSATAHDLTTPLVALRSAIGEDDGEARKLNERMMRLVENLRDFLKLGHRPAPRLARLPVGYALDEAYRLFAADYAEEESGPVEFTGDTSLEVIGDEMRLVQIFWNLFGNDLKYAAPYGRVSVDVSAADGFVRVAFADEGPGMTPRQRRRAFDRYYRAKTVRETGKGGFGIGLCTAREFAVAMGGRLSVRANEPSGCVFILEIPRAS